VGLISPPFETLSPEMRGAEIFDWFMRQPQIPAAAIVNSQGTILGLAPLSAAPSQKAVHLRLNHCTVRRIAPPHHGLCRKCVARRGERCGLSMQCAMFCTAFGNPPGISMPLLHGEYAKSGTPEFVTGASPKRF